MQRYELGYNWHDARPNPFAAALRRRAKERGIRVLQVSRGQDDAVRQDVDHRRTVIGLFLNTIADGLNMESAPMLLCRALKASGAHVVEDPDDARIFADRALLMDYLQRAGLPVPPHVVFPATGARSRNARSQLGGKWVARPARGMGINRITMRAAQSISNALARSKLRSCPKVLVARYCKPASVAGRELRFRVWHLFGHVISCWPAKSGSVWEAASADEAGLQLLARLSHLVRAVADISGLDWFFSEIVATGSGDDDGLIVAEPANALAMLGPDAKTYSQLPEDVATLAAERIVDVAWRRSRSLPLVEGASLITPE